MEVSTDRTPISLSLCAIRACIPLGGNLQPLTLFVNAMLNVWASQTLSEMGSTTTVTRDTPTN
eukprot:3046771-Amphidinium_carterae.1